MKINLFNPFNNYQTIDKFKKLNGCQKIKVIAATIFASLSSIWCLGLGGVGVFRRLVFKYIRTNILKDLFNPDDQVFNQNKNNIKNLLTHNKQIKDLCLLANSTKQRKKLIPFLYVFFGLKPVLIHQDVFPLNDQEKDAIKNLFQLNPHLIADFENNIFVNNKPLEEFAPKKFLKQLPAKNLKESALISWKNKNKNIHSDQYLSYILGYGPAYHIYRRNFHFPKEDFQFSDEHFRQLGKSLLDENNCKRLTDQEYIDAGKQHYKNLDSKGIAEQFQRLENNANRDKYYYYFASDEMVMSTEYWQSGIKYRDRLLKLLEIPLDQDPLDNVSEQIFDTENNIFNSKKNDIKFELFKIEPLQKICTSIRNSDGTKRTLLIRLLYVFFGLKPVMINENFNSLTLDEQNYFKKLSEINPHFSIDYIQQIAANEKPRKEFDPRRFLKSLPLVTLKDSTRMLFYDKEPNNQYLSYLLGFGPTYHVYVRRSNKLPKFQDFENYFHFTNEHYRQIGLSMAGSEVSTDDDYYITVGKDFYRSLDSHNFAPGKRPFLKEDALHEATNKITDSFYLQQVADEQSLNTLYWKKGIMCRERLFSLLDLPLNKK